MIYALIDKESLDTKGITLFSLLQAIEKIDVPILQYRNKNNHIDIIKEDLELIRRNYEGKIIINDYVELIDVVDGVHLGQEDIFSIADKPKVACEIIREKIGKKIFGLSTHNQKEIEISNSLDIDYIGLGAYRSTGTKIDAKVYGKNLLDTARYSKHPVALIGGVKLNDQFDEQITYRVIGSDLFTLL
jgi:thiamine-phosphate pyrophosphorylase